MNTSVWKTKFSFRVTNHAVRLVALVAVLFFSALSSSSWAQSTDGNGACAAAKISVLGTMPPPGTIDARQPFDPAASSTLQGIGSAAEPITIKLKLNDPNTTLMADP